MAGTPSPCGNEPGCRRTCPQKDPESPPAIPHILLLEDDRSHLELALRAFQAAPGRFRVTPAASLQDARAIIDADPPDLIIADWLLPDGYGIGILPRNPDGHVACPLIVMTSHGDENLAVEIMKSGAIDYLRKSATAFHNLPETAARALREWENIRGRQVAEEKAREVQKRLGDILAFLPDAVVAIDTEGTVIAWNQAMEVLTGIPAASMIGKGDHEYSIPFYGERRPILLDMVLEERPEIEDWYSGIRRQGDSLTAETSVAHLGGHGVHLWGTARVLYDSAGNRIGAIEVVRDITERKRIEDELRNQKATLETLVNIPLDTMALLDREGNILAINDHGAELLGTRPAGVIGRNVYSLLPPEVAGPRREKIDLVFTTGEQVRFEDERSGRVMINSVYPIVNADGVVDRVVVFASDITDRKKAEDGLRASEEKYRFLVDNVRDILWQATPDLVFTYLSPATERLTGWTAAELTGTSLFGVLTESSAAFVRERLGRRLEEERSGRAVSATVFEVEIRQKDGNLRWLEVSSTPSCGPDGTFTGFQGITRDITERKRAEQELRESEERYRALVNSSGIGVGYWSPEGVLLYLNKVSLERLQAKEGDLLGKSIREIFGDAAETYLGRIHRAAESDTPAEYEDFVTLPSGKGWFLSVFNRIVRSDGTVSGIQVLSMDITARRQAEAMLKEREATLSALLNAPFDILILLSRDGTILEINDKGAERIGSRPEEITGKNIYGFLSPEIGAYRKERFDQVFSTGERIQFEDSRMGRVFSTTVFPVYNPDHSAVDKIAVFAIDITDRKAAEEQLRQANRYNRRLIEASLDPLVTIGPDGRITDVNTSTESVTGRTRGELVGTDFSDYFTEPERAREGYRRVFAEGEVRDYPLEIRHRDGHITPVLYNASVYRDESGAVTGIFAAARDITERKRAEREQQESEIRFRDLFDHMSLGVAVYEPTADGKDFIIRDFNHAAETIEHRNKAEIAGRSVREVFPGIEEFGLLEVFGRVARTGTAELHPVSFYKDNRIAGWRENYVYRLPSGEVVAIYDDVTARKLADQSLRESEERYRALVEELPDFVIVHRDGELLYVNTAISRMLGRPAEDLLHTSIMEYIAPESREAVIGAMEKRSAGSPIAPYTARLLIPDGSSRWVEIRGAPIQFGGEPASFNILTDITDRKWAEQALYESEKKFRSIADFTYDWEYWMGKDGSYIYVSPSSERISGYSPDDFYRDRDLISRIVDPEDLPILRKHEEELSARPDPAIVEYRIRRKDGRIVWIGHICQPIFSPEGEYLGRRGSNRDITERRLAEDGLRASESRFRSLIQNASDIIRILDRDRKIAYESPSSERILGFPAGFLIGKDPREFVHPDDRKHVDADYHEVVGKTSSGIPTEFRILKADGGYLWVDAIGINLLGVPGIDGIVITIRPIQQRKLMEDELRENQLRLATAMEMALMASWEMDVPTGIFTLNDRFYALFGTTAEQEGGYTMDTPAYLKRFVHPDDIPLLTRTIGSLSSITDPAFAGELEHRTILLNGDIRYIVVRFGVILDRHGTVVKTRGASQDITDRKMMESEIRSLNAVLEQRVIQRTDELNRSLQEKEILLREIHHRVKNNLQIIISILRLQKRQIADDATRATLMDSESRVRSMALVHEKLYRSKDLEHIDIGDYLRALSQYLFSTYAVEQRRIVLRVAISELSLDIQRAIPIGLILNELISNALKHAFPDGRSGEIRISGKKEEGRILIYLEDNGAGFPEGLDWRHTQSLGMHLVMTLIEQVRGTIDLSTGSGGTRFTLSIPVNGGKGP